MTKTKEQERAKVEAELEKLMAELDAYPPAKAEKAAEKVAKAELDAETPEKALTPEEKARFKAEAAKRTAREAAGHTMGMILAGVLFGAVAMVISTCSGGK